MYLELSTVVRCKPSRIRFTPKWRKRICDCYRNDGGKGDFVLVAMIWRATPDRMVSFRRAVEFWQQFGDLRLFDSRHQVFNRAASRNRAVREAERLGHSKLVITDADTIPEIHPTLDALDAVTDSAVHLPYDRCRVLDESDQMLGEFEFTCGGVYVTTVNGWFRFGGQDERFTQWAPEDFAFKMAHETLVGPMVRHHGVLMSLSHNRVSAKAAEDDSDVQLYRRYERANGNPEAMRDLCFLS